MDIFALSIIAVITTMLTLTLRQSRPELAALTAICGGCIILAGSLTHVGEIISLADSIAYIAGVDGEHITVALKAAGIGMVVAVCTSVCADAGQTALAAKLEIAGRVAVMMLALPIIGEVFAAVATAIK